jgi:hypothetical protein
MCDVTSVVRARYEMNVVRHEAGSKDRQFDAFLGTRYQCQKLRVVRRLMKDRGLLVAAIYEVVAVVRNDCASRPWHARNLTPRWDSA